MAFLTQEMLTINCLISREETNQCGDVLNESASITSTSTDHDSLAYKKIPDWCTVYQTSNTYCGSTGSLSPAWSDSGSSEYSSSDLSIEQWNTHTILSSLSSLDDARLNQYDFHLNGIDRELDNIDIYISLKRQKRICKESQMKIREIGRRHNIKDRSTASSRDKQMSVNNTMCVFCKNNGEPLSVYGSHVLKDEHGGTTCPVLRRYTCPKCGASGESAHTIKYCPLTTVWDRLKSAKS